MDLKLGLVINRQNDLNIA